MPPRGIDPCLWEVIERVCTPAQQEVLALYRPGVVGFRQVAMMLGVTREAVQDRYQRAAKNIQREVRAMRGIQGRDGR